VGALFGDGTLRGSYRSNIDRWLTDWYTGGAELCRNEPDYLILDTFTRPESAQKLLDEVGDDYHLQMRVAGNGEPRLLIYGRENVGEVKELAGGTRSSGFSTVGTDRRLPITPWSGPAPMQPLDVRFGDSLAVKGARVDFEDIQGAGPRGQVLAGETIHVTLNWEMLQQQGRDYKVFLQLINPDTHKAGQRDTTPACAEGPTTEWNAGDSTQGYYRLSTAADAPPGPYALIFGVYDAATQELLGAHDGDGNALGDTVTLREIYLVAPPGPSTPSGETQE
jgi:hypothetical protein